MSCKKLISAALALILALSLCACGPATDAPASSVASENSVPENTSEEVSVASEEVPEEASSAPTGAIVETLRIGTTRPADSFNIMMEDGSYGKMNYNSFSAAPFLELNQEREIQPYIMTDWDIADDQMSVVATFATDKGITWHDGQPLTIDDIIFTFGYMIEVKQSSYLKSMSSVEKIDDKTLKLNFDTPAGFTMLTKIAPFVYVYPKHIWEGVEDYKGYTGEDASIGCGPYKLVDIDEEAQIVTYEAVENYFKGELTVKNVVVRSFDSHDALVMALRNGEIDAMYDYSNSLDSSMKPSITGIEGLDEGTSVNPGNFQMVFGFNVAPTNDLPFRQAVASALDYELLATAIGGEDGEVAGTGIISPAALGHDSSLPENKQDIEKAKQILDEAGYVDTDGDGMRELPTGEEMSVLVTPQFNSARSALYLRICEITIENLSEIGVRAVLDEESVRNSDHCTEFRKSGQYEIYIGYTSPGVAMFDSAFMYMVPNEKNPWGTCTDETFNAMYEQMMNVANYEEYIECSHKLQQMAGEIEVGIALCWDRAYFPYRTDKYTGWVNYPGWGAINSETWYNLRPL